MVSLDFEEGRIDPCIFVQKRGDRITVALMYVDDILAFSSHIEVVDDFKHEMNNLFETNNLKTFITSLVLNSGWQATSNNCSFISVSTLTSYWNALAMEARSPFDSITKDDVIRRKRRTMIRHWSSLVCRKSDTNRFEQCGSYPRTRNGPSHADATRRDRQSAELPGRPSEPRPYFAIA